MALRIRNQQRFNIKITDNKHETGRTSTVNHRPVCIHDDDDDDSHGKVHFFGNGVMRLTMAPMTLKLSPVSCGHSDE